MTTQQILQATDGCATRCPHCRCFSIRIPKDGSAPFCIMERCTHAYQPDSKLRPGAPSLHAVEDNTPPPPTP